MTSPHSWRHFYDNCITKAISTVLNQRNVIINLISVGRAAVRRLGTHFFSANEVGIYNRVISTKLNVTRHANGNGFVSVRAILLKNNEPVGQPSDPTYVTVNP